MGEEVEDVGSERGSVPRRCPSRGWLRGAGVTALLALAALLLVGAPAQALIHHGHEPGGSFGAALHISKGSQLAVNEKSGDVYVVDSANNRVDRFGPKGEFIEAWGFGVVDGGKLLEHCTSESSCLAGLPSKGPGGLDDPVAIAVDNSGGELEGDVYVVANSSLKGGAVDRFSESGVYRGRLVTKEEDEEAEGPIDGVAIGPKGVPWVDREQETENLKLERFSAKPALNHKGEPSTKPEAAEEEFEVEPRPESSEANAVRPGLAIDAQGHFYVTYEPGGQDHEEMEEEREELKESELERKEEEKEEKLEEREEAKEEREEEREEKKEEKEEAKEEKEEAKEEKTHEKEEKLAKKPHSAKALARRAARAHRATRVRSHAKKGDPAELCTKPCVVGEYSLEEEEWTPINEELASENTSGVAVDRSTTAQAAGDIYLDNLTHVSALTASDVLIQSFASPELAKGGGTGLAVNAATEEVFAVNAGAGDVERYVLAKAGPPSIEQGSVVAADVTSSSAEIRAGVDANGSETHYYVEYCVTATSSCVQEPVPPGSGAGSGFGDQATVTTLHGLEAGTEYEAKVLAKSTLGEATSETLKFATEGTAEAALLDGRAWELVSPSDKHGAAIGLAHEGSLVRAAVAGNAISYVASAPTEEGAPGNRAPEPQQIMSTRVAPGVWRSQDISTPNKFAHGDKAGERREYQAFSPDLSLALVQPLEPLSGLEKEAPNEESVIYLREERRNECAANPNGCSTFNPIVTQTEHKALVQGVTANLEHAGVFADEALVSGAPRNALYLWSQGEGSQLVSVLSNKETPSEDGLGEARPGFIGPRHAISEDGSRVVWGYAAAADSLFMRLLGQEETLTVNEPESGLGTPDERPVYQTANGAGTMVFFTDTQQLTRAAPPFNSENERQELYVFEPERAAEHRVTDISPSLNSGEPAGVIGGVLGASEDGTYVYFVANGVLAEGAEPGDCGPNTPTRESCNLYVVHYNGSEWERPRLIARLSNEDNPDWGQDNSGASTQYQLLQMTSRVSPNGKYLAFMSDRPLTGHATTDVNSGAHDEQVFLYDAESSSLVCASCSPSNALPDGVHDVETTTEGRGLLVDRTEVWSTSLEGPTDHWLAANIPDWDVNGQNESLNQARFLSNEGRLFFNSASGIVAAATNRGTMDVYEYEPTGIGGCASANTVGGCVGLVSSGASEHESAFLEASETGDDVFFETSAKLSPLDTDKAFDVYDAHVCSSAAPCASVSPPEEKKSCSGEAECRGSSGPRPLLGLPATESLSISGNIVQSQGVLGTTTKAPPKPLTRAQKLAAALKACKKDKKKSKRQACEKQAHKKYGTTKTTKKAKKSSRGRSADHRRGR